MTDEVKVTEGQAIAPDEAAELKKIKPLPVVMKTTLKAPLKVAAPVKPVTPPKPTAEVPKPQPKPAEQVVESDDNPLVLLIKQLPDKETVTITKLSEKSWAVTKGVPTTATFAAPANGKPKKAKSEPSEMYVTFMEKDCGLDEPEFKGKGWRQLPLEQKYAFAQALEASWVVHENSPIDLMRMTTAVLNKLGIKKTKDEEAATE
jgi:hypothetical protein